MQSIFQASCSVGVSSKHKNVAVLEFYNQRDKQKLEASASKVANSSVDVLLELIAPLLFTQYLRPGLLASRVVSARDRAGHMVLSCHFVHRFTGQIKSYFTCPITAASSDGRRNTCLKFTRRSLKSQGLSWMLIQAQRDLVELRLRIARQVGSSREVLP
jgi:hypothetical protein